MKSLRRVCRVTGAPSLLAAAIACGGSQQKSPGVTNMQPSEPQVAPTVAPVHEGRCLSRGTACSFDMDCCSQWCVNSYCATRQP
jgi:hypothetical protein